MALSPGYERAARALAEATRGCDDDFELYVEDVEIVLRETGVVDLMRRLADHIEGVTGARDGSDSAELVAEARALLNRDGTQ